MANALFGPLLGEVEAMFAREHTPLPGSMALTVYGVPRSRGIKSGKSHRKYKTFYSHAFVRAASS
jgi:hypothetical protein